MTQAALPNFASGIDSVPTQPSSLKAAVVSIAAALLAVLGCGFGYLGRDALAALLEANTPAWVALQQQAPYLLDALPIWFVVCAIVGGLCGIAGFLSLLRTGATYQLLRFVLTLVYPVTLSYIALVWLAVYTLLDAQVPVDASPLDQATAVLMWWGFVWPALAITAYVCWLHVMLASRPVVASFTKRVGGPMRGDHILENWRTHGRDPRARRSLYTSVLTHIFIIILIPYMLRMGGCVEAYKVPQGSGNPVVAMVKVVQPKKKKKKTLTLRPNSAIIFDIPDLDNTEVDRQMEEMTQLTYEASVNAKAGKIGKGGGTQGGWPEGMEDYRIRFIRLDHGGRGWDDGMNQTQADMNFLRYFAKATGFTKIASRSESHSIALLDKYPDTGFPPFVFFTGDGGIGRTSERDRQTLREYCLNGGMLIADAGSAGFHRSFVQFMRQVFPDKPLLDIADDDMIYQLPFGFPNGAPAFWGHGGRRAMGIKHEGRWVVFYHPGDMNDAWKSAGYSDVTPEMRDSAMNLGVNLVYYAFNQWNDAVTRNKK